jgi:hypothetical protein
MTGGPCAHVEVAFGPFVGFLAARAFAKSRRCAPQHVTFASTSYVQLHREGARNARFRCGPRPRRS